MSAARGANQVCSGQHLTCGWMHEWDFRMHEWDFRAGPGSRMGGSFVAMWTASGGAGGAAS
jgi:hypothetical protein